MARFPGLAGVLILGELLCAQASLAAEAPWSGLHLGLEAGLRADRAQWTTLDVMPSLRSGPLSTPGAEAASSLSALGGFYMGHDWRIGERFVVGAEADLSFARTRDALATMPGSVAVSITVPSYQGRAPITVVSTRPPSAFIEQDWETSLRARMGVVAMPDLLVYATAGAVWRKQKAGAACAVGTALSDFCGFAHDEVRSHIAPGWTVGLGVEKSFGPWVARAEYRHARFRSQSHLFFNAYSITPGSEYDERAYARTGASSNRLALGLAYRF